MEEVEKMSIIENKQCHKSEWKQEHIPQNMETKQRQQILFSKNK